MSKLWTAMRGAAIAATVTLIAMTAAAAPLPAPTGTVILEVTGAIANTNADGKARFDRAALEALSTSTPWTKGVQHFRGFPLPALLKIVGSTGDSIKAIALNDYSAVLPVEDSVAAGAFVAVRANGAAMSVRDRGPLWIVFPYDTDARLTTDAYLNRSVWQIKELVVD